MRGQLIMTGIPSSETIILRRRTINDKWYYITTKPHTDIYYIYEITNDKATKLGKGATPPALEEKFIKE